MPGFNVTYEFIDGFGETIDSGFSVENVRLGEALDFIDGPYEANEYPITAPRWVTAYEYDNEIYSGVREIRALHFPETMTPKGDAA